MPRFFPVTGGSPAPSSTLPYPEDRNEDAVTSLFDAFRTLATSGSSMLDQDASCRHSGDEQWDVLVEQAPVIMESLERRVREQPRGARETLVVAVGDDSITVSECDTGLQITDNVSGESCIVFGMDFGAFMQALSEKVFRHAEFDGDAAANPERETLPPTLTALPQEMRTKVAAYLSGWDAMALACTSKQFCNELGEDMSEAGFGLITTEGVVGVKRALALLNNLPASYRLKPLQRLAEDLVFLATKERRDAFKTDGFEDIKPVKTLEAFEELCGAACDLMPEARAELFGSLAYAAQWLDAPEREAAWRKCVAEIEKANVDPYGKDSVALNLIGSYAMCLMNETDRRDYFDRFLSVIAGREASDAGKGHALANLADSISELSAADKGPAFNAVGKLIAELDSGNQGRGSALRRLIMQADLASQEQFSAMADLVLELPPTDRDRTIALYHLAKQMSHTRLFASDPARFEEILRGVAALDVSDSFRAGTLLALAQCIKHLPVENQVAAREMIESVGPLGSILFA